MSATESELAKTEKAEEEPPETPSERLERELAGLRESGILEKKLPVISRATFDRLSPRAQMDFMRRRGELADNPEPAKAPIPEGAIKRSAFERMTPADKLDWIKRGGTLVDDDSVAD